jgi:serine/threonine protein kinase
LFSEPKGATVYLDDEPLGDTDPATGRLVKTGLTAGSHRLRVGKDGWEDAIREVPVAVSGATEVRVELSRAAALGFSPLLTALLATAFAGLAILGWRRLRGHREPAAPAPLPNEPPLTDRGPRPSASVVDPRPPAAAALSAPALSFPGEGDRFGEYTLREALGKGGMAAVFLAERGDQLVALKRPLPGCLDDAEFRERFLREAELGRTLSHPNIIRMVEQGEVNGVPFFTMEYLQGRTLHARLKETGAFASGEACRIVFQVAEALDYAHHKGVVHRDLKPSNIMILRDGTVKVMDYGIARALRFEGITVTGAFMGTPDYVAPEIAEGKGTDARSDLYSLGVVFYELLAGRKPFVGDTPFATLRMHVSDAPAPPSSHMPETPPELEAVVLKLLAKDPNDRYQSAEALLLDLRGYLNRAA